MTMGYRTFRDSDAAYWLYRFEKAGEEFVYAWGPVHKAGFERRVRAQFPEQCDAILAALRTVTVYDFWIPSSPLVVPDEAQVRRRASGGRPKPDHL